MTDLIAIGYSDPATAEKARDPISFALSQVVVASRGADGAVIPCIAGWSPRRSRYVRLATTTFSFFR